MTKKISQKYIYTFYFASVSFIFQIVFIQSYITLPFTYINKKTNTSNPPISSISSYYETYLENTIYTSIKLNPNNNKEIKFHITFDRYATYISESLLKKLEINPVLAYDEEKEEKLYSLEYIGISRSTYGNYTFNFIQNNTINTMVNDLSFFISKKLVDELPSLIKSKFYIENEAEIGFNIFKGNKITEVIVEEDDPFEDIIPQNPNENYDEEEYGEYGGSSGNEVIKGEKYINKNNGYEVEQNTNLVNQLKSKKIINSYVFTIKYDDLNNGKFIIGSLPHEYDPRHYNKKFFIYSNIVFKKEAPSWKLIFDKIKYDEEKLISSNMAEFNINFGFISTSITYKDFFDQIFFKKEENINSCYEEKLSDYFYVKYCKKDVIKNFKTLNFFLPNDVYINSNNLQNNKFEFNYEDLFIKSPLNEEIYLFQIVFRSISSNWILGKPLFKKYQLTFDQEKKIVGFYKETGLYEYDDNNNKTEGKNILPWVLVWILFFAFIILGFLFYEKVVNGFRRKKKANELEDDFVYELSVKKNNNNNDSDGNKNNF